MIRYLAGPARPVLALALLSFACRKPPEQPPSARAIGALTEPWMRVIAWQATPSGLRGIRASDCGECHRVNLEEWKSSTHAHAWTDEQFQAEMKKDRLWVCRNCHTPLENQLPYLVTGLFEGDLWKPVVKDNPSFDPALQREGVTCAACHVRGGEVLGPREIEAPHPVRAAPEELGFRNCQGCHNARARFSKASACWFDTVDSWRSTELPDAGVDCVDCHLPRTTRVLADGGTKPGREHFVVGSGIPKTPSGGPVRGNSGLVVALVPRAGGYVPGDTQTLTVTVTNERAGHSVPTGDVERFSLLELRLLDEKGLPRWSHRERFGQVWEWWPEARQLSDGRLNPGQVRTLELAVPFPADLRAASLEMVLENHRITEENSQFNGLSAGYPRMARAWRAVEPLALSKGRGGGANDHR